MRSASSVRPPTPANGDSAPSASVQEYHPRSGDDGRVAGVTSGDTTGRGCWRGARIAIVVNESPELAALARRWIDALGNSDAQTILNLFSKSPHTHYIGSDPAEEWKGSDVGSGVAAHAEQFRDRVGWKLEIDEVAAYESGTSGFSIVKSTALVGGYDPISFRSTSVWELEGGVWRIVHNHNSVPVTNQSVIGVTLTSSLSELLGSGQEGPESSIRDSFHGGIVAIMFTDIVDSSGWVTQLGDEAWAGVVSWHDGTVREIVEQHDGTVVKTLGDGTMTAFDSTRNAARSAIAIQKSVVSGGAAAAIGVRIGLHVGEVLQSGDDYLGQAVHKAARIASAGGERQIMVSSALQALLEDSGEFEFGPPVEAEFKGFEGTHLIAPLEWSDG